MITNKEPILHQNHPQTHQEPNHQVAKFNPVPGKLRSMLKETSDDQDLLSVSLTIPTQPFQILDTELTKLNTKLVTDIVAGSVQLTNVRSNPIEGNRIPRLSTPRRS